MTLQELKTWIDALPEDFLEYQVVHAEAMDLDSDEDELGVVEYTIRVDKPITALTVDEDNKEILIMNDYNSDPLSDLDFDFDEDPNDGKEFGTKE